MSAQISKEVKALARQEWFPIFMRELGYEAVVRCGECIHNDEKGRCELLDNYRFGADWYCADGERRADDE